MAMIHKIKGVTSYSGLAKFYFKYLLKQLIKVGDLERAGITILDFGCGKGELKRTLPNANVIGYDIIAALSDVRDWRDIDFDVLVANEVFYSFTEDQLVALLTELKQKNSNLELVVGISRQSVLNNIGKFLLGRPDAHSATKIGPKKELEILLRYCEIKRRRNILYLADVILMTFKI